VATQYVDRIKTGVRGVGYVKVNQSAEWPDWLENVLPASAPRQSRAGD
jgi:HlyD family secretion protein